MFDMYATLVTIMMLLVFIKYDDETKPLAFRPFVIDLVLAFIPPVLIFKFLLELKEFLRCRN